MAVEVVSSGEQMLQNFRALVYGPPGHGKTFSCVTASERCPADFTHLLGKDGRNRAPTALDDMLWIAFDSGAIDGFNQQKLSVPMMDLSHVGENLMTGLNDVIDAIKKLVAAGGLRTIVIDTISALDEIALVYWRNKGFEKWDLYGNLRITHMRFAMALKAIRANILFLAHAKAAMEPDDKNKVGQNKIAAAGLPPIYPAITGDSLNHYRRDASFILPLIRAREGGVDGRWFYTTQAKGFEAKTRFLLNEVEPADWRVILGKARNVPLAEGN